MIVAVHFDMSDRLVIVANNHLNLQWVRSFSFPGSTPVCPWCVRKALTSFQGFTRGSPQCPACGVGQLGVNRGA